MIGDTCLDMDAPRAAGIEEIGVWCGYGSHQSREQCADRLFKNAPEAITPVPKG
jgi:phosphoglycolate phosphatase-like HAD superfamily hydrolase